MFAGLVQHFCKRISKSAVLSQKTNPRQQKCSAVQKQTQQTHLRLTVTVDSKRWAQHFYWFCCKNLFCPKVFRGSGPKALGQYSTFAVFSQSSYTVPIFGAFGHQEASRVPKDLFFVFGTVQQFSVWDWFFWTAQHFG